MPLRRILELLQACLEETAILMMRLIYLPVFLRCAFQI